MSMPVPGESREPGCGHLHPPLPGTVDICQESLRQRLASAQSSAPEAPGSCPVFEPLGRGPVLKTGMLSSPRKEGPGPDSWLPKRGRFLSGSSVVAGDQEPGGDEGSNRK